MSITQHPSGPPRIEQALRAGLTSQGRLAVLRGLANYEKTGLVG